MMPAPRAMEPYNGKTARVWFTTSMTGHVSFGEEDHLKGAETGRRSGTDLTLRLVIVVDSIDGFIKDPSHRARAGGYVRCEALGGKLPIRAGTCNLLVVEDDPRLRRVHFRVHFHDAVGHPLTVIGDRSLLRDARLGTTALFTRIVRGHVEAPDDAGVETAASGLVRLRPFALARQLTSVRTQGPSRRERYRGLYLFVDFLARELWRVHAKRHGRTAVHR